MNELQIFKNDVFGEIRTVEKDGKPYFVASDVARALGYINIQDAIKRHCRWVVKHDVPHPQSPEKKIEVNVIPEGDLYRLISHSELPNAEQFDEWIFDEVLPSIRKNGGYIANQENLTEAELLAKAVLVAQNVIAQKDRLITEMKPKAEYFDELVDRNLLTSFRDTAKELHVKEKDFINYLLRKGYVYRDTNGKLQAHAEFTQSGKGLFDKKEYATDRHAGTQTLITPKGRETFRLLIKGIA